MASKQAEKLRKALKQVEAAKRGGYPSREEREAFLARGTLRPKLNLPDLRGTLPSPSAVGPASHWPDQPLSARELREIQPRHEAEALGPVIARLKAKQEKPFRYERGPVSFTPRKPPPPREIARPSAVARPLPEGEGYEGTVFSGISPQREKKTFLTEKANADVMQELQDEIRRNAISRLSTARHGAHLPGSIEGLRAFAERNEPTEVSPEEEQVDFAASDAPPEELKEKLEQKAERAIGGYKHLSRRLLGHKNVPEDIDEETKLFREAHPELFASHARDLYSAAKTIKQGPQRLEQLSKSIYVPPKQKTYEEPDIDDETGEKKFSTITPEQQERLSPETPEQLLTKGTEEKEYFQKEYPTRAPKQGTSAIGTRVEHKLTRTVPGFMKKAMENLRVIQYGKKRPSVKKSVVNPPASVPEEVEPAAYQLPRGPKQTAMEEIAAERRRKETQDPSRKASQSPREEFARYGVFRTGKSREMLREKGAPRSRSQSKAITAAKAAKRKQEKIDEEDRY
jgi:hypothetical protein